MNKTKSKIKSKTKSKSKLQENNKDNEEYDEEYEETFKRKTIEINTEVVTLRDYVKKCFDVISETDDSYDINSSNESTKSISDSSLKRDDSESIYSDRTDNSTNSSYKGVNKYKKLDPFLFSIYSKIIFNTNFNCGIYGVGKISYFLHSINLYDYHKNSKSNNIEVYLIVDKDNYEDDFGNSIYGFCICYLNYRQEDYKHHIVESYKNKEKNIDGYFFYNPKSKSYRFKKTLKNIKKIKKNILNKTNRITPTTEKLLNESIKNNSTRKNSSKNSTTKKPINKYIYIPTLCGLKPTSNIPIDIYEISHSKAYKISKTATSFGLGAKLLQEVIKKYKKKYYGIILEALHISNEDTRVPFYTRLGFKKIYYILKKNVRKYGNVYPMIYKL